MFPVFLLWIFPCDSSIKDCLTFLRISSVLLTANRDRRPDQKPLPPCVYPPFLFPFFPSVSFFSCCVPCMDPFTLLEYLLLLLEQGERSLKGHIKLFLVLANLSSSPDDALCAFYDASLNSAHAFVRGRPSSEFCHLCGVPLQAQPTPPSPSPPRTESQFPL